MVMVIEGDWAKEEKEHIKIETKRRHAIFIERWDI